VDNIVTVTIDVPKELLCEVEEQSRSRGESVSQFFTRGAQTLLRRHKERRMLEEYVEARTKMPDPEEVEEARRKLQGQ
jgi:metal-responsive CopG/Arc/MetJ family transcriptional regulator